MKRSDFYYELPPELIAQRPANPRDSSRLLHLDKETGAVSEHIFRDIATLLRPGDLLIVNDSKVIPARLRGTKEESGGACEVLLLRDLGGDRWECLVRPGRRLQPGARMVFGEKMQGEVVEELAGGNRVVHFTYQGESFLSVVDEIGAMPLPHYITAPIQDAREYQTVYAQHDGSAAAPTAGFHFTLELLDEIHRKGIGLASVTLHVGLGTFRPVKEDDITRHLMHREYFWLPQQTVDQIRETKEAGGRVVAVGTTTCRTLEATAQKYGDLKSCQDSTEIFIYPGYKFKVVDALITNFHLPESTLIMLVSALAGYENTMAAYQYAVKQRFRFFSFGDAMFIE